ncbi:MAG: hypothetical protein LBT40_08930 [Deltaproteobacteria bacterium]|nr:hypothetical protein [Deltaproteobacteria bacterium]
MSASLRGAAGIGSRHLAGRLASGPAVRVSFSQTGGAGSGKKSAGFGNKCLAGSIVCLPAQRSMFSFMKCLEMARRW